MIKTKRTLQLSFLRRLPNERENLWEFYETWTVWRHIKNDNKSADDSFSSDSDNSLPEPINEIESGEENSHGWLSACPNNALFIANKLKIS